MTVKGLLSLGIVAGSLVSLPGQRVKAIYNVGAPGTPANPGITGNISQSPGGNLLSSAADGQSGPPLEWILQRMQQHETTQSLELKHYDALRHYQVQYKGFGTHLAAAMGVQLGFDSTSGKNLRIVSQTGSKLLCDKVLRRAVESEAEASKDKSSTALNTANYRFQLAGTEERDGHRTYILRVDPLKKSKFLFRGKVWIDAQEFAVVRIEVEPAQNPSFWITSTRIESTNSKTDGIWLPEKNRSESRIRVGGTAVLTIDYGTYHIARAAPSRVGQNGLAAEPSAAKEAAF